MTEHDIGTLKVHCNGYASYNSEVMDEFESNDVTDYLLSNNKDDDFVFEW